MPPTEPAREAQAVEAALATLRGPLAVVAHDAGGAEILSSLLRRHDLLRRMDCRLALAGPARAVFTRKLGAPPVHDLASALAGAGTLLCGTGWASSHEWQALRDARAAGVHAIAVLDHWVNYRERFVRDGCAVAPDALWLGDADALALARRVLPDWPAHWVPNAYFADSRDELAALAARQPARPPGAGARVLYVCEPMREPALRQFGNARHHGYVEEEALAYALARLPQALGRIESVLIRPHPSEAPDKYDAQLAACALPVLRGGDRPLFDEVAASDVVVGCSSMAMVIGLIAGRRVFSAIPPGGAPCVLPQRQITMLRDLPAPQCRPSPAHTV